MKEVLIERIANPATMTMYYMEEAIYADGIHIGDITMTEYPGEDRVHYEAYAADANGTERDADSAEEAISKLRKIMGV